MVVRFDGSRWEARPREYDRRQVQECPLGMAAMLRMTNILCGDPGWIRLHAFCAR